MAATLALVQVWCLRITLHGKDLAVPEMMGPCRPPQAYETVICVLTLVVLYAIIVQASMWIAVTVCTL